MGSNPVVCSQCLPCAACGSLGTAFQVCDWGGIRLQQCCIKARVGEDPVLGTDPDKQELALQGAGQGESRSGAVGGPGSVRAPPQRRLNFSIRLLQGRPLKAASTFFFMFFAPTERFLSATL